MEAAVAKQPPPEPVASHDGRAEATRSTEELFQWSTHVDVGTGAQECEHSADGLCTDQAHFHAWLCLPNTFQARDISEKALAAKARKRRTLLQDGSNGKEASDANLVLEEQLDAWLANDTTFEALCQQIADRRVRAEYQEITRELGDTDQFEHYGADLEEFRRLGSLPEDQRDQEEWDRLSTDLEDYRAEFEKRAKARYERELDILKSTSRDEVVAIERRYQIDQAATEQFLHVYYTWAYFICARVPSARQFPTDRVFKTPEDLRNCAPEVLDALRTAYRQLEGRLLVRGDAAGN